MCLLLGTMLVVSASGGQEEPAAPEFGESLRVDVVNVEVFVTDKDGVPLTGLGRDDFELFVDGRPIAITNFYAVDEGHLPTDPSVAAPEARVGPLQDSVPVDQQLHLVVYVDNRHLQPATRNRALNHLRTFIRRNVGEGDRVMLVTHDQSVHVRQAFTENTEEIVEALFEVERMTGFETQFLAERQEVLDLIYQGATRSQVWSRVRALTESRKNVMRGTLRDLEEYIGVLAGLPGRKAILYVSDGLPMRPVEDIYQALYDELEDVTLLMEGLRGDMSQDFDEITRLANANRITFYTLEAAGLRSYSYTSAESASIAGGPKIDNMHFWNLRSPLIMLAAQTGGQAIVGTNNQAPALARIGRDFRSYYSLGFTPPPVDPVFHKIGVRLREKIKGVEIRHREGYRSKDRRTVMVDGMRSLMQLGHQPNPMGLRVSVGSGKPEDGNEYSVPVLIDIPIREISLIPRGTTHWGQLRVYISAADEVGRDAAVSDLEVPISIPSSRIDEAMESDYRYQLDLRMRRGSQVLAIGVEDEIGGTRSFVATAVSVGS
jgi:VWFA-related protein